MNKHLENSQDYWLSPHVVACTRIEGTVLLDLNQNRYFALSVQDSMALSRIVFNWPTSESHSCTDRSCSPSVAQTSVNLLLNAKLLSDREPDSEPSTSQVITPLISVGEEISEKAKIDSDIFAAHIQSYRWARRNVKHRCLNDIRRDVINMRSTANSSATRTIENETIRLVSAFRSLRPLSFTAKDRCLIHSLSLLKFLARYGVFPNWIIGIRLRPWGAHSWIQLQEYVLDSTPEKVCPYTPILIV